jgi:glycosyltransferase involved in cell wall biosynthesis
MSKIIWFVSSLEQKGGGERFALEATQALRDGGHQVQIVCDRLDAKASFDGKYDLSNVQCTSADYNTGARYFTRVLSKTLGLFGLGRIIHRENPDLVVCQSEYDTIKLYVLSRVLRFRYRSFVFGQMYQFKTDISRYSSVFLRHLETIVASRPGYRETVQLPPPRLSLPVRIANELISRLKYRAHHKADRLFTLSQQVAWEVSLVYGRESEVARAAFSEDFIDELALANPRPVGSHVRLVSLSRLVDKKRIDLMVAAFSQARIRGSLSIIGTGPDEACLRALAERSPRSADIHFLGALSDSDVALQLKSADCLVSLDIGDYDISVVEAMGKACRVIVAQDFDLASFGSELTGAVAVAPTPASVAAAMDSIPSMAPPSLRNLPTLKDQTWKSLAIKVSRA